MKDIRDPEHPYSLEQLNVLSEESITVDEKLGRILFVLNLFFQLIITENLNLLQDTPKLYFAMIFLCDFDYMVCDLAFGFVEFIVCY